MGIEKTTWWLRLFRKDSGRRKIDALESLDTIKECLTELPEDCAQVLPTLEKLEELEKERKVLTAGKLIRVNIETQAKLLDELLKKYSFIQNDVDINGIRLAGIAEELLRHAKKAGLADLVKEKKKDIHWRVW